METTYIKNRKIFLQIWRVAQRNLFLFWTLVIPISLVIPLWGKQEDKLNKYKFRTWLHVLYFDQCLGAAHPKCWLKYVLSTFFAPKSWKRRKNKKIDTKFVKTILKLFTFPRHRHYWVGLSNEWRCALTSISMCVNFGVCFGSDTISEIGPC